MATKTKRDIRPFKAVITIVFAERNEKGEVIGEIPTQEQLLYLPDFDKFPQRVKEAEVAVNKQLNASQNGSG